MQEELSGPKSKRHKSTQSNKDRVPSINSGIFGHETRIMCYDISKHDSIKDGPTNIFKSSFTHMHTQDKEGYHQYIYLLLHQHFHGMFKIKWDKIREGKINKSGLLYLEDV